MQEEGFEPPTGSGIYSAGRYQLRCYSCDTTLRSVSSPVGLFRQVLVLRITSLTERFTVDEYLCGIVFVSMFCYVVIFHNVSS